MSASGPDAHNMLIVESLKAQEKQNLKVLAVLTNLAEKFISLQASQQQQPQSKDVSLVTVPEFSEKFLDTDDLDDSGEEFLNHDLDESDQEDEDKGEDEEKATDNLLLQKFGPSKT